MFIKASVFKKLVKAAWGRNGLLIGNTGEEYIISGGHWAVKVEIIHFPKKEKAAIIELTGELPTKGKFFRADHSGNQYEFGNEYDSIISALSQETKVQYNLTKTSTIINTIQYSIIQDTETNDVKFLNGVFSKFIDNKEIEEEIEMPAYGPSASDEDSNTIIWRNGISTVVAYLFVPKEEDKEYEYLCAYQRMLENMELH